MNDNTVCCQNASVTEPQREPDDPKTNGKDKKREEQAPPLPLGVGYHHARRGAPWCSRLFSAAASHRPTISIFSVGKPAHFCASLRMTGKGCKTPPLRQPSAATSPERRGFLLSLLEKHKRETLKVSLFYLFLLYSTSTTPSGLTVTVIPSLT